jgi:hypothetical protein
VELWSPTWRADAEPTCGIGDPKRNPPDEDTCGMEVVGGPTDELACGMDEEDARY